MFLRGRKIKEHGEQEEETSRQDVKMIVVPPRRIDRRQRDAIIT